MSEPKAFDYLLKKIEQAKIETYPFKHINIQNLFDISDFKKIISCAEIQLTKADDDDELFNLLFDSNYRIIRFPGCIADQNEYISWHKERELSQITNTSCEGFGMVLRLEKPQSKILDTLNRFLNSEQFINCISNKFDIDLKQCTYDAGIQKYLDGYEISPHPDIRKKALTYMVNINPDSNSEDESYHTHYLKFNEDREYVKELWCSSNNIERCWVPWDWCATASTQRANNSMVIFSPDNDTMHAVKASYNHLKSQRTQLYGNLWYKNSKTECKPEWEDLTNSNAIDLSSLRVKDTITSKLKNILPRSFRSTFNKIVSPRKKSTHSERKF